MAIIGGGAAGFFAAIRCATLQPSAKVVILEKSSRLLTKVKISGGGRCNVTHACYDISELVKRYPRGGKKLRNIFSRFGPSQTIEWFEQHDVKLKTEADGRMFPVTDNSLTIVNCLLHAAEAAGVQVLTNCDVKEMSIEREGISLKWNNESHVFCKVLVATGGSPKEDGLSWLKRMGIQTVSPVPSLFSFNIKGTSPLMGCAVSEAKVTLAGGDATVTGPLLLTHWGMSGPAILRISAECAPVLAQCGYRFSVRVSWLPQFTEESLREEFSNLKSNQAARQLSSMPLHGLPRRLWEVLLSRAGIDSKLQWAHLSRAQMHSFVQVLLRDEYAVEGKTTYKEEFVTCGGVELDDVDLKTMESKKVPGLYFAGEVLDIDGITGGFNFQAAWTTGFIAGTSMATKD